MSDAITIIRGPHDADHKYFVLCRAVPQDERLSWAARGVLCYLLSKPSDWEVQVKDLQQHCGRDKVYKVLAELRTCRYLVRDRIRQEDGTFEWGLYRIYETPLPESQDMEPLTEKAEMVQPLPDLPYTDLPYTVNQEIVHSRESTKERILQKERATPQAVVEQPPLIQQEENTATPNGLQEKPTITRPPRRRSAGRDPLLDNEAVGVYCDVARLTPNAVQRQLIAEQVEDMAMWRRVVTFWMGKGWRPQNVDGMLDSYKKELAARRPVEPPPERPDRGRIVPQEEAGRAIQAALAEMRERQSRLPPPPPTRRARSA